jgi:hypothetical protein
MVWNRSKWIKHPETGHRVRQERPQSEWIVSKHPELAIVDDATWEAVQTRLQQRRRPNRGGSSPRHLLSGLLRCGQCGGPMVVVDRYRYGCATAKDRGTCTSRLRVPRKQAEAAMLGGIKETLLSDEAFQHFQRAVRAELKRQTPDTAALNGALAAAERVHSNIMAALRAGIITPSTKAELLAAEAAVTRAKVDLSGTSRQDITRFLPRAREHWERLVADLASQRQADVREAVRELVGTASVTEENGVIYAELESSQIRMVAGACYVFNLTTPARIQIGRKV